jgi:hypothetical protein
MNEEIRIIRSGSTSLAVVAVLLLTACQARTASSDLSTTASTKPAVAVAVGPEVAQCHDVGAITRKLEQPVKLRKERARSSARR